MSKSFLSIRERSTTLNCHPCLSSAQRLRLSRADHEEGSISFNLSIYLSHAVLRLIESCVSVARLFPLISSRVPEEGCLPASGFASGEIPRCELQRNIRSDPLVTQVFEAARNLDGPASSRGSGSVEALFERCSIKKHLMGQVRPILLFHNFTYSFVYPEV